MPGILATAGVSPLLPIGKGKIDCRAIARNWSENWPGCVAQVWWSGLPGRAERREGTGTQRMATATTATTTMAITGHSERLTNRLLVYKPTAFPGNGTMRMPIAVTWPNISASCGQRTCRIGAREVGQGTSSR